MVLAIIATYFSYVAEYLHAFNDKNLPALHAMTSLMVIISVAIISVFGILLPVWFSGSNLKKHTLFGYKISFSLSLFILAALPFLNEFFFSRPCGGGWVCLPSSGTFFLIFVFVMAVIFTIFYKLVSFLRRSDKNITKVFIIIELIIISYFGVYVSRYVYQDMSINNTLTALSGSQVVVPEEASKICNNITHQNINSKKSGQLDCWEVVVVKNPGVDACVFASVGSSQEACLRAMRILYEKNDCFPLYSSDSWAQGYNAETEKIRANNCWSTAAKTYPRLDVCTRLKLYYSEPNPWGQERCLSFLENLPK